MLDLSISVRTLRATAFAAAITWAAPNAIGASAENKAAARELGTQGIQLAREGKCDEALPLLERAEKLYHAPTILGWVGECQVELGRLVQGTENLNRVVREQLGPNPPTAFVRAQERARTVLEEARPKIGKLTIVVEPGDLDGVAVSVDGSPVAGALLGAPRPTDPGSHEVVARATGYVPASTSVELSDGASETITLTLEVDPNAVQQSTTAMSPTARTDPAADSGGSTESTVGWVGVGVGGALLAGGGITGLLALGKKSALEDSCPSGACPRSEQETLDSANSLATLSTVLFGAGGAIGIAGLVLLLTDDAPDEHAEAPEPTTQAFFGPGTVGIQGSF